MVVLDTNIFVAALWSQTGASNRLVTMVLRSELAVGVSVALALEYEDVLKRAKMREASWASLAELDDLLDAFLAVAKRVTPITIGNRPMLKDADDDMVLECALQCQAKTIVTMNLRDFSTVESRFGIGVSKPGDFLATLMGEL